MRNNNNKSFNEFEKLVIEILKKNNFKIEHRNKQDNYLKAVLNNTNAILEIKFYTSKLPNLDLLKQASKKLTSRTSDDSIKFILVVSNFVTPSLKEEMYKKSSIIVWDISTLFILSFEYSNLYYKLNTLLSVSFNSSLEEFQITNNDKKQAVFDNLTIAKGNKKKATIINKDQNLCKELKNISSGKEKSIDFEKKCIEILKYLFDNPYDLTSFEPQRSTDDEFHRFDLLCRIVNSEYNNFWTELSNDFHSRFVLFEFKNYTNKITQKEIYTTEKYLFSKALRSIGIIIAKNDADNNAKKAAKGALRETGKLILILNLEDLCEMLTLKDNGDEPSIVLRKKVDNILGGINR